MEAEDNLTLSQAITRYLSVLPSEEREKAQLDTTRFVRWYGGDRLVSQMTIPEIGNFAEVIATSGADPVKKLQPVKSFLSYLNKQKLIKVSLAAHLRIRKANTNRPGSGGAQTREETVSLTQEGHTRLETELKSLKDQRPRVAEELKKAAADKDFRENAPLDAAREHQGQLEARIRTLEATLKSAVIMDQAAPATSKVSIGNTVTLRDLTNSEQVKYTLVSPTEANPLAGKVSTASPLGKAMMYREQGQTIEFQAPSGIRRYEITAIER